MKMTSKIYAREIIDEDFTKKKVIISKRDKNLKFMEQYGITESVAIEIVKSLSINYFKEKRINNDPNIPTDYLYVFKPLMQLNDEHGETIDYVYIKICKIDNYIFTVSFHPDDE